jgi:hypothetical protein
VLFVKQKLFKLREKIEVFRDESRSQLMCTIQADRIIDWSARYHFTAADGSALGSVGRKGMRSIWRAHYEIFNPGDAVSDFEIKEENPWAKVGDSFFGEIPILGMFAGYLFHPRYLITRKATGQPVFRLSKQSAFWEGRFLIEKFARFGNTVNNESVGKPIHCMRVAPNWSLETFGTNRPWPAGSASSGPRSTSAGNSPITCPPATDPPMTNQWFPHP